VSGKAGFQKADLMDYGSLYGMGSYFGVCFGIQRDPIHTPDQDAEPACEFA